MTRRPSRAARPVQARGGAPEALLPPPEGLQASVLRVGDDLFALLDWPVGAPSYPMDLTASERAVLDLLLRGLSDREIARQRGRSHRTVANQIAAIYTKLGVHSRLELFTKVRGGAG